MARTAPLDRPVSTGDALALAFFVIVGAALAAFAVLRAVLRILDVAANRNVQVLAEFAGTPAQAPIGPGGALREVLLDRVALLPGPLDPTVQAAAFAQPVVRALAVLLVAGCLSWLAVKMIRGRLFDRANSILVAVAGIGGLVLWALDLLLGTMVANGALSAISGGDVESMALSIPLEAIFLIAYVAAVAGTAFTVGDRLRRETEGLV